MTDREVGKKKMNFNNYTLGGVNIIRGSNLAEDKNYSNYVANQLFDYKADYAKEVKLQLDQKNKFITTMKKIDN